MPVMVLAANSRSTLLQLARATVREAARIGRDGVFPLDQSPPAFDSRDLVMLAGGFVSLHLQGNVRGCVGTTAMTRPLAEVVVTMARAACLRDLRFDAVRPEEVDDLEIEISVLEAPEVIQGLDSVEIGRHGLIAVGRGKRGLLLPQVAVERDWDVVTFARQTCRKAGLDDTAYMDDDIEMSRFCAEVFSETGERDAR